MLFADTCLCARHPNNHHTIKTVQTVHGRYLGHRRGCICFRVVDCKKAKRGYTTKTCCAEQRQLFLSHFLRVCLTHHITGFKRSPRGGLYIELTGMNLSLLWSHSLKSPTRVQIGLEEKTRRLLCYFSACRPLKQICETPTTVRIADNRDRKSKISLS